MATPLIEASITAVTGITPDANLLLDAQSFVVSSIPKDLLKPFQSEWDATSDNGLGIDFAQNDSITYVERNGYNCAEIPLSESKWALDSSSLKYATKKHPKYYLKNGKVEFAPPTEVGEVGSLQFINPSKIDDSSDLKNAVIFRAISSEYSKLARSGLPTWSAPNSPIPPSIPNFGSDSSIGSLPPVPPTLSSSSVDISGWSSPSYSKQVLSLTSTPSIGDLNIGAVAPSTPSAPNFTYENAIVNDMIQPLINVGNMSNASNVPTYQSKSVVLPSLQIDSFPNMDWEFPTQPPVTYSTAVALSSIDSHYPIYTMPVCPMYDFDSVSQALDVLNLPPEIIIPQLDIESPPTITWNIPSPPLAPVLDWSGVTQVVEDLDLPPDIVAPSLEFDPAPTITWNFPTAPVSPSYNYSDLDNWINSEEDSEMAASRVQAIQTQVSDYSTDVQSFQTVVNAEIAENQGKIKAWSDEWQTKVSKYSTELNGLINKYQGEAQGKSSIIRSQVDVLQAQLNEVVQRNTAEVNTYQANISAYQTEVNAEVTENQGRIQIWGSEWSTKVQAYSAEVNALVSSYSATQDGKARVSDSQVKIFQAELAKAQAEYTMGLQKHQNEMANASKEFEKTNAIFSLEAQRILEQGKLDNSEQERIIQKYIAENQAYQTEVNAIIQQNTAEISAWQNEWSLRTQVYTAEVGAEINKYQSELQDSLNVFNKENVVYQEEIQTNIQNLQKDIQVAVQLTQNEFNAKKSNLDKDVQLELQNAINNFQKEVQEYSADLQKYGADVGLYQQEINKEVQQYTINEIQKELSIWNTNVQTDMQTYNSDMQNELNKFNELNTVFQAQVQKSIQDAQLESADDGQAIQKYSAELQEYQQNINKEVSDFTNNLNKNVQEYQSELSLFSAEVGKFQALVAEQAQSTALDQGKVVFYEKEASKYYQWAINEINTYIQNNSKMINRTIAAQVAAQQQGQ